ncbi:hypothetical protein N657DRAFT_701208 [Parathielavia appendiculata]|uniref:Uncharacterized protein n=1 Tax=Parathielavia appendiculata TaxID=2587402 RepID=A0AAN6Z032_9PEZI|nr:hypothetical protein N657DRAFT_701208 [Parathielavia appendiculata]
MGYPHCTTPKKAKVEGAVEFLEANKIPHFKSDVFKQFGVTHPTGWRYLREAESYGSRTYHSAFPDRRGRKSKTSDRDLATIECFIESNDFDGRTVPYAALPAAAGLDLDVSARTVRRAVGSLDFRFYVAYQKH